jgi:hypothetical protein
VRLLDVLNADKLADFWGILREVDPRSIEREAARPVKIIVCGAEGAGHRAVARDLTSGSADDDVVDAYDMPHDVPVALPSADAYIYVVRADQLGVATVREHLWQLSKRGGALLCAVSGPFASDASSARSALRPAAGELGLPDDRVTALAAGDSRAIERDLMPLLFAQAPQLSLAVGRRLPVARAAAVSQIILETAKVNAEFAAVSSIPAIVPVVGGIAATGADLVVLTKNQAMLLIKLATIFDLPTGSRWQLMSEIMPIVGAAFMWRWAARTLVSLLPSPLSVAPRVAVAYVGTYVVGRAAAYYYELGRRPPPDLLEGFAREAASQIDVVGPLLADVRRRFPIL